MDSTPEFDGVTPETINMQTGDETDGSDVLLLNLTYVRAALLFLYSFVFLVCFFGNLAVLMVTWFHKKMRSSKNFILGNLAASNLCVGLFCIYQNLYTFLVTRWNLGSFPCKTFHFVSTLSHAASVLILLAATIERYVIITKPIRSRWLLTMRRKRLVIITAWMLSILLSFHKFYYATLIQHHLGSSLLEVICTIEVSQFNHKMVDMLSFIFLFVLPLVVICFLHIRIGICLQRRRSALLSVIEFQFQSLNKSKNVATQQPSSGRDIQSHSHNLFYPYSTVPTVLAYSLQARDKTNRHIAKILAIVALCFAVSNLPFHLRKMLQNYTDYYSVYYENPWLELLAPLTFVVMYSNCAVSPFAHALLSKGFQNSLIEVVSRSRKNNLRTSVGVA